MVSYVNNNILYFLNTRDSSQPTTVFSRRWCKDHGSTWLNITMGGQHDVNGVVDRFRIYNNNWKYSIHNIAIWGNENIGNNMTKKEIHYLDGTSEIVDLTAEEETQEKLMRLKVMKN